MIVKIKKLTPEAIVPKYAHEDDACFDLVATKKFYDEYGNTCYSFGLAFEIPHGFCGLIFPRSSNCKKSLLLANSVGVIDSGYRGEVSARFKPTMIYGDEYKVGDRVAQMMIVPVPRIEFELSEELTETSRGEGGYGSSGN